MPEIPAPAGRGPRAILLALCVSWLPGYASADAQCTRTPILVKNVSVWTPSGGREIHDVSHRAIGRSRGGNCCARA
jgi:hypothetical protein